MSTRPYQIVLAGILAAAVGVSAVSVAQRSSDYAFFDELIEIKSIIDQRYVTEVDAATLREGAIRGMVEALNDPFSVYVPPAERAAFNIGLTGRYVGIGALIGIQNGVLTIVSPLEGSPAFEAGLWADDRVVEIDGSATQGLSTPEAARRLQGPEGTTVTLTVERGEERRSVTVRRGAINTRSVRGFHRDPADPQRWRHLIDPAARIAYVRLTQFKPGSAAEVSAALEAAADGRPLGGLVLDVRGNPGGLLSEAVAIADLFLNEGVIVSTRGRAIPAQVTRARREGTLPEFPIAVLIDQQSASASEVLAGALADNGRSVLVGVRSFGKGSVQSVFEPASGRGSELKLTEQLYYLPSGRSLSRTDDSAVWGVDPTEGFVVPLTEAQVAAMMEVRRREEVLRTNRAPDPAARWSDPEWILEELRDPQLAAGVRAVQKRLASGAWQPTGEAGSPSERAAADELRRARAVRERLSRELDRLDRRVAALQTGAPDSPSPADLWADSLDLTGGSLVVRDKGGAVVATLAITGPDLERALREAGVAPLEPSPGSPTPSGSPAPALP